jgi:ERF superfamily
MNTSETTAELSVALAAAQAEIEQPRKTETAEIPTKSGGSFSYRYADLGDVVNAALAVLPKFGLAIVQEASALPLSLDQTGAVVSITTRILHASGEWIELGPLYLPAAPTAQGIGSAITYGRRYALSAALGIAAEDDDATAADSLRTGVDRGAAIGSGPADFRIARTTEAGELGDRLVSELAATVPDKLAALADKGFFSPAKLAAVKWYLDRAAESAE